LEISIIVRPKSGTVSKTYACEPETKTFSGNLLYSSNSPTLTGELGLEISIIARPSSSSAT